MDNRFLFDCFVLAIRVSNAKGFRIVQDRFIKTAATQSVAAVNFWFLVLYFWKIIPWFALGRVKYQNPPLSSEIFELVVLMHSVVSGVATHCSGDGHFFLFTSAMVIESSFDCSDMEILLSTPIYSKPSLRTIMFIPARNVG